MSRALNLARAGGGIAGDNSGNVIIGYRAVVGQATAGDSVFQVYSASYGGLRIGYNSTAVNYIDSGTLNFRNAAGSVTNAVIDSGGNLGVGNASTGSRLYVASATNTTSGQIGATIHARDTTAATGVAGFAGVMCSSGPSTDYVLGKYYNGSGASVFQIKDAAAALGNAYLTINPSGDVGIGVTSPAANSFSLDTSKNLFFTYGNGNNYATIFNQTNSAALVLSSGLQKSATVNGYASSVGVAWGKSAITLGHQFISMGVNASGTTAVGTDVTLLEKLRLESNGILTKYDDTTNTYIRDHGVFAVSNSYIHIKLNVTNSTNRMIGFRLYGYLSYSAFIDTYYGCYLYSGTPSTPYGSIIKNAADASSGAMYYAADGYLVISCVHNANGYTGVRLETLCNGGSYGGGVDVQVLAYKGSASATGAY